jgi:hypothetical protein
MDLWHPDMSSAKALENQTPTSIAKKVMQRATPAPKKNTTRCFEPKNLGLYKKMIQTFFTESVQMKKNVSNGFSTKKMEHFFFAFGPLSVKQMNQLFCNVLYRLRVWVQSVLEITNITKIKQKQNKHTNKNEDRSQQTLQDSRWLSVTRSLAWWSAQPVGSHCQICPNLSDHQPSQDIVRVVQDKAGTQACELMVLELRHLPGAKRLRNPQRS